MLLPSPCMHLMQTVAGHLVALKQSRPDRAPRWTSQNMSVLAILHRMYLNLLALAAPTDICCGCSSTAVSVPFKSVSAAPFWYLTVPATRFCCGTVSEVPWSASLSLACEREPTIHGWLAYF